MLPVVITKIRQNTRLFALGSIKPIDFLALCRAIEKLPLSKPSELVQVVSAASGVNPQPFGLEETQRGAHNCAVAAASRWPEQIAIGIEDGLVEDRGSFFLASVVVVRRPDDLEIVEEGERLLVPSNIAQEIIGGGFNSTIGQILVARFPKCYEPDPHCFLSEGRVSRFLVLTSPIQRALTQAINNSSIPRLSFSIPQA